MLRNKSNLYLWALIQIRSGRYSHIRLWLPAGSRFWGDYPFLGCWLKDYECKERSLKRYALLVAHNLEEGEGILMRLLSDKTK